MKLMHEKIPSLRGSDAKKRFHKIYNLLENTQWPIYLVGPSGSGKTLMAMNAAKYYAKKHKVPAYYVQLSPDQTKTSLILGLRLEKGSLVPKRGVVAEAMEKGAIIVVDEAPHASQELLLMFNSVCDRTSVTAIGDDYVVAKDSFRVIFAGNNSNYAANQKLPQSFAQRLIAFNFDYPCAEDESSIAYKMYKEEFNGKASVPKIVCNYVVNVLREVRTEKFPLSIRNAAAALMLMDCNEKHDISDKNVEELIASIAYENSESFLTKVYSYVNMENTVNIERAANDNNTFEFLKFVAQIGKDNFIESVLSASLFYLDIEGFDFDTGAIKDKLRATIF